MSKTARAIIIVIVFAIATAIAITRPWTYFEFIAPKSAITINAVSGKLEVYLNEQKVGETPFEADSLTPGTYNITLKRVSETDGLYSTFSRRIDLESNTRTVLKVELGPSDQFSSHILVYFKKANKDETSVYVESVPSGATVTLDEIRLGTAPLTKSGIRPGTYRLKVAHPGYEDHEVEVQVISGYTLITDVKLMARPIEIRTID